MSQPEFVDTPGYGDMIRERYSYRQAVRIGDRVEISGQGGWDDDQHVAAGSLEDEIGKAFDNVEKTLRAAGATWDDVVKVNTYHVPTSDEAIGDDHLAAVVDQFRKRSQDHLPLWTALGVKSLGLPEMRIEVEAVAVINQRA
ncbi:Rid family hydrolase [Mycolicibacterium goodii]|uniref:Endoribonuclease L-PSP n=1 Tax=Mycolicibacterium goodii TaxID=134601 RepID=A0A0K0XA88_MYCGD|nr:endoribonuclease L-PSP [Mycolicibacterium goodii]